MNRAPMVIGDLTMLMVSNGFSPFRQGQFVLDLERSRGQDIMCVMLEFTEMVVQECDGVAIDVEFFHSQIVFEFNIPHPLATVASGLLGWRLLKGGLLMLSCKYTPFVGNPFMENKK